MLRELFELSPDLCAALRVITVFINRIMRSPGMSSFIAANINAKIDGGERKVNYCWGQKATGTEKK